MADGLKRTPLYDEHVRLGGRMVDFAGYAMPVQYEGIVAEHKAVREKAGLFDVSHMGEFIVRGPEALDFVQLVTTNDASRIEVGQAQYTVICQEDGGAIDDCLLYRFPEHYMLVVNASNRERVWEWMTKFAPRFDAELVDRSDEIGVIAVQGPAAERIVGRLTDEDLSSIGFYRFIEGTVDGVPAIISRTGYTGEDGFELYVDAGATAAIWRRLLEVGADDGVAPAGLGSRDSLRLELGYLLYGNDLDANHTPLEAGLGWAVKLDKGEFIGREALSKQKEEGVRKRLVGFRLEGRGFPRRDYEVRHRGESSGQVTSGLLSPSLEQGIGFAYIAAEAAKPGTEIEVVIRNRPIPAEVVRPPFYKDGSLKR